MRCHWTNGVPQNLFDQKAKTLVNEVQQLKGSCPFVYALTARRASGASSPTPSAARPSAFSTTASTSRAPTRGSGCSCDGDLAPTPDGSSLVDYTEELWEAAYLDEATLMAVDHPDGTPIVPNERMIPGPRRGSSSP